MITSAHINITATGFDITLHPYKGGIIRETYFNGLHGFSHTMDTFGSHPALKDKDALVNALNTLADAAADVGEQLRRQKGE